MSDGGSPVTTAEEGSLPPVDAVPRSARWLVGLILAALMIPGLVGFEAWPLTGWRLFSLSRDESQTVWVLEALDTGGTAREVSLEELPLGYRHAEWPMTELLGASTSRRERVCDALLAAVADLHPDTTELRLLRDRQRLVEQRGAWLVTHDPEVFHSCRV
jgi:hypothetical protein